MWSGISNGYRNINTGGAVAITPGKKMLVTSIKHGELEITLRDHGAVEVYRPSSAERIVLSASEWVYLTKVCELHGWPVAPPVDRTEG